MKVQDVIQLKNAVMLDFILSVTISDPEKRPFRREKMRFRKTV